MGIYQVKTSLAAQIYALSVIFTDLNILGKQNSTDQFYISGELFPMPWCDWLLSVTTGYNSSHIATLQKISFCQPVTKGILVDVCEGQRLLMTLC